MDSNSYRKKDKQRRCYLSDKTISELYRRWLFVTGLDYWMVWCCSSDVNRKYLLWRGNCCTQFVFSYTLFPFSFLSDYNCLPFLIYLSLFVSISQFLFCFLSISPFLSITAIIKIISSVAMCPFRFVFVNLVIDIEKVMKDKISLVKH